MDIHIVGGTYREICAWPHVDEFHGSGGRAAELVCQLSQKVKTYLHTAQEASLQKKISANIALNNCIIDFKPVAKTPTFKYLHPLSSPEIYPSKSSLEQGQKPTIKLHKENVLVFGMLEAKFDVRAKRLVYDPQNPLNPKGVRDSNLYADELALVLNRSEAMSLYTQHSQDPKNNHISVKMLAQEVLNSECVDVVVIKCGHKGAFIYDKVGNESWVNAYETKLVFPIGSGDCFAAAFAYYWMAESLNPTEASLRASVITAYYCENRTYPFFSDVERLLSELKPIVISHDVETKKVYLAGPFFNLKEFWMINETRDALKSCGLDVFSPYHDIGVGSAIDVVHKDIDAIEDSDIIYALFDGNDPGTLFEIGYAIKCKKPVVIFAENATNEQLKMYEGTGCHIFSDFTTSIYQTCWKANG